MNPKKPIPKPKESPVGTFRRIVGREPATDTEVEDVYGGRVGQDWPPKRGKPGVK